MDNHKFLVTSTPHIRAKSDTSDIMFDVIIALSPAAIMGAYYFGFGALYVIVASIASCVLFEFLYQKLRKQPITINDYSAVVTGLLLAFNMPSTVPFWVPIVGSFFAIILAKQLFGGIGQNFINPALVARAFLLAAYPTEMTTWPISPLSVDAVSSVTPLALLKTGIRPETADFVKALIGTTSGCIGETCAIALIIGGVYLLIKRVISWRIPVTYICTVFVFSLIIGRNGFFTFDAVAALYELLVGGLMLGAIFMATDYTSSPVTPNGKLIMGLGCGILTVIIRSLGTTYPEGVSYSILLMNLASPLIEKITTPRIYGEVKANA